MIYEKELSDTIIGAAIEVHKQLGNGFLETVYENALMIELQENHLSAENQKKLNVYYKNQIVGEYFADIIVEDKVIIELKVCQKLTDIHKAQLINYLKATGMKIGYLLNFGAESKLEFIRLIK
jgi:GxxExxY protein